MSTTEAAAAETVIRPPGRWPGLGIQDLKAYRELWFFLTKRELLIRYKQSVFGVGWAVLQPLAYAFVFALIFGRVAKLPSQGVPYPLFALAGIVPWIFVSQSVSQAAVSLVADANLLSKVYFPRLVLPVARVGALLVDFAISIAVLLAFSFLYGRTPSTGMLLLPVFILIGAVAAIGIGTLLAAMNVQYRDIGLLTPLLVQLWLFATPIIYPGTLITGTWKYIYALNPAVTVIEGFRWAFISTPAPEIGPALVSAASALLLLIVGVIYFRRTERYFADVA